ncbi:MAG: diacylglycerol kinase family protein [Longibaculum sp.]
MSKPPFYKSLGYAINGIKTCIFKERNIKIHIFMMICVIACGFIFQITYIEWMLCFLLFALVISLELVNTAIEAVVDLCSPKYHELAKVAKDTAAGAVLISALFAAVIGLMIFVPKLFSFLFQ